jgi:hypothetical protein
LNVPHVEVSAESFSYFGLEGTTAAPEIHAGGVPITAIKCDGVALRTSPCVSKDSHHIWSQPMDFFDLTLVSTKPNCRTSNRDFTGFELEKL